MPQQTAPIPLSLVEIAMLGFFMLLIMKPGKWV